MNELEARWAKEIRTLCASIAGEKLFPEMWVHPGRPVGSEARPWGVLSLERPFPDDWPEGEDWTLAVRCFSYEDAAGMRTTLDDSFAVSMMRPQLRDEIYVPPVLLPPDSFRRAVKVGLEALSEFSLVRQSPFLVQLMLDDGGVDQVLEF